MAGRVQKNPEVLAQTVMHDVLKGNTKAFETFLATELEPGQLNFVLEQLKHTGNQAFREGHYHQALEAYQQCLAGTKDAHGRAVLLSNMSASYLQLNDVDRALDAARDAISAERCWAKPWFRAAQVLMAKHNYTAALAVFRAAAQKEGADPKEMQTWLSRVEPLAVKEKALERLSVDYSRFANIDVPCDDVAEHQGPNDGDATSRPVVEYSEKLSKDERRQLDALLTGQPSATLDDASTETKPPRLFFDPSLAKTWTVPARPDKMYLGLLNLLQVRAVPTLALCDAVMQTQSELACPKRVVETQVLPRQQRLFHLLIQSIQRLFRSSGDSEEFCNILLLGTGAGIVLVALAKCLSTHEQRGRDCSPHLVACTNHRYPFLTWIAQRMLRLNDVTSRHLTIVTKRITELTMGSRDQHHPLDDHVLDMPRGRATTFVIDPELFDCTGIGRGALQDIRYARLHLVQQTPETSPIYVSPGRLQLWIYGVSLKRLDNLLAADGLTDLVHQGLWGVAWEPVHGGDTDSCYVPITESRLVFEFVFDGPSSTLDTDIPLQGVRDVLFNAVDSQSPSLDGWIVDVRLRVTTVSADGTGVEHRWAHGLAPSGILFTESMTLHGVAQDAHPPATLMARFTHQRGQLDVRVLSVASRELTDVNVMQRTFSLPRWQLPYLWDTGILARWNRAVCDAVDTKVQQAIAQIDRRRVAKTTTPNVEVLLFYSSLGTTSLAALHTAAAVMSHRPSRPNPTVHVTALEPSEAHAFIGSRVTRKNAMLVDEEALRYSRAATVTPTTTTTWTYFTEHPSSEDREKEEAQVKLLSDRAKLTLKARLLTTARDPRRLRPPESQDDGIAQMALAQLLGAPAGPSGPALPPAAPMDRLPDKADVVVSQMLDCGLLGEGLLPLMSYALSALSKPHVAVIPARARVCAAVVELGTAVEGIRTGCLTALVGDIASLVTPQRSSDYIAATIDDWNVKVLSESAVLFEFDFEHARSYGERHFTWDAIACEEGVANAVVYWVDVLFESPGTAARYGRTRPLGFSTRPQRIPVPQPTGSTWMEVEDDSTPASLELGGIVRARWIPHAMQLLGHHSLFFKQGEMMPFVATQGATQISVHWDRNRLVDFKLRQWPSATLFDDQRLLAAWYQCAQQHAENLNKMMPIYMDRVAAKAVSSNNNALCCS